jgi:hypothetical protein
MERRKISRSVRGMVGALRVGLLFEEYELIAKVCLVFLSLFETRRVLGEQEAACSNK